MNGISRAANGLFLIVVIVLVGLFSSCGDRVQNPLQAEKLAFGAVNQVIIIADSSLWNGPVGDTISFYYSSAYPVLPQPEPIFNLRHFTPEDLRRDPLRQELRNYLIIANLENDNSATTRMVKRDIGEEKLRQARESGGVGTLVGRNKWAKGQLLIYIYAYGQEALTQHLINSFPAVARRIEEADAEMVANTLYFGGRSTNLEDDVRSKLGVEMRLPKDYYLAAQDSNFVWLRRETPDVSSNILLKTIPYTDQSQLTREYIKSVRDSLGRRYVSSTLPNTYMKINDVDLPMFTEQVNFNGNYALEARGIWEIANDFMGGAFISYLIFSPDEPNLLFVDAFIHAPGEEKRNLMQQMEYILHTIKY